MPRIGRISKWFSPQLGHCYRCETNWLFVNYHQTRIDDFGTSVFPLCERCWEELQPLQRLSYYRRMYEEQLREAEWNWNVIETAVLNNG